MTDEFRSLDRMRQGDGRDGRSPISQLKLVVYNAFVDSDYITRAFQKAGSSWIKGTLKEELFSIMKYDLLLTWSLKKQWRNAQVGEETTLRVFSVLNGMGNPGDTRIEMLSYLRCAGFAGTPTREDSTGQAPKRDLPVVLGGLYNAWNTGDEAITQGDWVYWDLPEDNAEIMRIQGGKYNQGRPKNRFLALLRPYNPKNQEMNAGMLRYFNVEAISRRHRDEDDDDMIDRTGRKQTDGSVFRPEFADWAVKYAESARGLMFLGAIMAASGIFGPVPDGGEDLGPVATESEWIDAMRIQMTGKTKNTDFAEEVAKKLGLAPGAKPNETDVVQVANRLMFPDTNVDRLVKKTMPHKNKLNGIHKTIYDVQASTVQTNLRSGEEVRQFVKGRIVGKAMESVAPGDFFDISIGSYAI